MPFDNQTLSGTCKPSDFEESIQRLAYKTNKTHLSLFLISSHGAYLLLLVSACNFFPKNQLVIEQPTHEYLYISLLTFPFHYCTPSQWASIIMQLQIYKISLSLVSSLPLFLWRCRIITSDLFSLLICFSFLWFNTVINNQLSSSNNAKYR